MLMFHLLWNIDVGELMTRVIQGYPGTVVASVSYTLEGSSLQIRMRGMASGQYFDKDEKYD